MNGGFLFDFFSVNKTMSKKAATNKSGVKNSLVNNIHTRQERSESQLKSKSTITKKSYDDMQHD